MTTGTRTKRRSHWFVLFVIAALLVACVPPPAASPTTVPAPAPAIPAAAAQPTAAVPQPTAAAAQSTAAARPTTVPSGAAAAPGQPLKIGMLSPFTGNLAWYGQELSRGYELAGKKINASGGIKGRPIEFVKADAPDATPAVAEVERLANQGIKVVIGTGGSAIALAASASLEKKQIVFWETNALDNGLTSRGFKYTLQFGPNNDSFADASLSMLKDLAPKATGKQLQDVTVALVWENSAYGTGQAKVQRPQLQSMNVKIVADESYDRKASDLSSVILRLRSANPDVVIETGYQDDIVLLWRQAKELGYLPRMIVSSGVAATQDFANALGPNAVDGIIGYNYPYHEMPEGGAPGATAFAKAYQDAHGSPPPSGHSLAAYAGMLALGDVLAAAGSDTPDAVVAAARSLDKPWGTYPGGQGLRFTETGRNTRARAHGFQWQGGKMFTIWPAEVANGTARVPLVPWDKR